MPLAFKRAPPPPHHILLSWDSEKPSEQWHCPRQILGFLPLRQEGGSHLYFADRARLDFEHLASRPAGRRGGSGGVSTQPTAENPLASQGGWLSARPAAVHSYQIGLYCCSAPPPSIWCPLAHRGTSSGAPIHPRRSKRVYKTEGPRARVRHSRCHNTPFTLSPLRS